MPHCCILEHNLHATVNFNLVAGWLNRCEEEHVHSSAPLQSPRQLTDLRFVDVGDQCIAETSHHVRYAALIYTWGSHEQYCLSKQNTQVLEKKVPLLNLNEGLLKARHPLSVY
jgi:hypothetical protein